MFHYLSEERNIVYVRHSIRKINDFMLENVNKYDISGIVIRTIQIKLFSTLKNNTFLKK